MCYLEMPFEASRREIQASFEYRLSLVNRPYKKRLEINRGRGLCSVKYSMHKKEVVTLFIPNYNIYYFSMSKVNYQNHNCCMCSIQLQG